MVTIFEINILSESEVTVSLPRSTTTGHTSLVISYENFVGHICE